MKYRSLGILAVNNKIESGILYFSIVFSCDVMPEQNLLSRRVHTLTGGLFSWSRLHIKSENLILFFVSLSQYGVKYCCAFWHFMIHISQPLWALIWILVWFEFELINEKKTFNIYPLKSHLLVTLCFTCVMGPKYLI